MMLKRITYLLNLPECRQTLYGITLLLSCNGACIAECGPLPCPDWYAAGLMTGSGWFDSAHGRQVYHFYPFTPLALRLGVVFCFLDVMLCSAPIQQRANMTTTGKPACITAGREDASTS